MKYYNIESSIENQGYISLLNWALDTSQCFSLVWRDDFEFGETAKVIESKLKPFLIKEELTNEWPGTTVFGPPENTIRFYKVNEDSINILKSNTSISSWVAPDYPEDLAFYKSSNDPWFGSVAHENIAFFFGEDFNLNKAFEKIPGLKITN